MFPFMHTVTHTLVDDAVTAASRLLRLSTVWSLCGRRGRATTEKGGLFYPEVVGLIDQEVTMPATLRSLSL